MAQPGNSKQVAAPATEIKDMTEVQLAEEIARVDALEAAAKAAAAAQAAPAELVRQSTTRQTRVRVLDGSSPSITMGRITYAMKAGETIYMHPSHARELEQAGAVTVLGE